MSTDDLIDGVFALDDAIRYVAVYRDGELQTRSKSGTAGSSSSESDRYEELIVNPTLLRLTTQRGDIDCGGLNYVIVRYGNFFQLVWPLEWGHVSVCVEKDADPVSVADRLETLLAS